MNKVLIGGLAVVAVALLGGGYALTRNAESQAGTAANASAAAASGAGAAVSVSTALAQRRDVDVTLEATGTVVALNSVEIRPRINSVITQVKIREGQFVRAGELLFTLDASTDEANLARTRSQLAKDAASLADAQRQWGRSRDLLAQNFISQSAVDTNQSAVDAQQAVVNADRAAIRSAEVGLSYTRIVAPAAGRAGAINVFAGSTVQSGSAALVTITQLDPIAVAFSVPQRQLDDVLALLRAGGGKVTAVLPERQGNSTGRLQFVDNAVDPNSGTVRVKARFDNRDERLWPGAFVTVRLALRTLKDATLVPQAAIIQSPRGDIVYTLDAQQRAVARPVQTVYGSGPDAVVTGVEAGEQVVLDGRQNLRPGALVVERASGEVAAAAATAPGASAAAP